MKLATDRREELVATINRVLDEVAKAKDEFESQQCHLASHECRAYDQLRTSETRLHDALSWLNAPEPTR